MKTVTEKFYSKTDLAEHFGIPESSVRFYCERFAPYLEHVGQGRKRRYAPSSLEVIEFIRTRMPDLRTSSEMDLALIERFPVLAASKTRKSGPAQTAANPNNANSRAIQLFERQTKALESIAASLDRLDLPSRQAGGANDADLTALRAEIRDLRYLVKGTEKTQQEDMEQVRGLIMRLAKGK